MEMEWISVKDRLPELPKEEKVILGVDKIFHDAYFASAWYKRLPEDIRCAYYATPLKVYYAEDKLYAVKCPYCEIVTLIKANSPIEAAKYVGEEWEEEQ